MPSTKIALVSFRSVSASVARGRDVVVARDIAEELEPGFSTDQIGKRALRRGKGGCEGGSSRA